MVGYISVAMGGVVVPMTNVFQANGEGVQWPPTLVQ